MPDNSLIDNLNNSKLLSPDDALAKMIPDDEEQIIAREVYANGIKRQLKSLGGPGMKFGAPGKVTVLLTFDGEPEEVDIPIRPIPSHVFEKISEKAQEKGSEIPSKWDPVQEDHAPDKDHPRYLKIMSDWRKANRELLYDKLLYGILIPIEDSEGKLVWDDEHRGPEHREMAIARLNELGILAPQIEAIVKAIDALSLDRDIEAKEDIKKK